MSNSQSGSRKRVKTGTESSVSSKTKKSSAYDGGFDQHLFDHGIYMDNYDQMPSNWAGINNRIVQRRRSLSPSRFSEAAFTSFRQTNKQALTESMVMSAVFSIMAGSSTIPHLTDLQFGNLKALTDGTITNAKPDWYDGLFPAELNPTVRAGLGPFIVPSTNTAAPCMPKFFMEAKGPNGNTAVCKRQALYDGALGARGVRKLRSYVDPQITHDQKHMQSLLPIIVAQGAFNCIIFTSPLPPIQIEFPSFT